MKCRISSPAAQWIFTTALTNGRNGPLSGWPSCLLVVPSGCEARAHRGARMPSHLAVPPDVLDLLLGRGKAREELPRNAPEKGDDLCRRWG